MTDDTHEDIEYSRSRWLYIVAVILAGACFVAFVAALVLAGAQ